LLPLHMCAIILTTTITIATLMVSKAKFWKMHLELNPKNCKQESKNNNLLGVDMGKEIESTSDVDEKKIPHNTIVQKEVSLSSLRHKEEKEMTKLFHIKIQVKKNKVDALFNSG